MDRLVELHVLSENGDPAAAEEAATWITDDAEARRVWNTVEHTCQLLRSAENAPRGDGRTPDR